MRILHPATLSFVESSLLIKEKLRFLLQNTAMYSDPTRGAEADPAVTMQRMPRLLYTSTSASAALLGWGWACLAGVPQVTHISPLPPDGPAHPPAAAHSTTSVSRWSRFGRTICASSRNWHATAIARWVASAYSTHLATPCQMSLYSLHPNLVWILHPSFTLRSIV